MFKKTAEFLGYQIHKIATDPMPSPNYLVTEKDNIGYYETPIGNYFLPHHAPDDVIFNHMKAGKIFEPYIVDVAKRFIKKGSIVLDIGSNFGQMSTLFSKLVGDEGLVYAFEADDFVFEILKKNLEANNCKNVIPIFGAVYNQTGKELVFPKQDFERFKAFGSYGIDPSAKNGRIVKSLKIDDIDFQKNISFVKVDIQGSDLFALQGAKDTLKKHKPPVLFEFEQQFQQEFKTSFQDYVDFVNQINYRFEEVIAGINFLIKSKEAVTND